MQAYSCVEHFVICTISATIRASCETVSNYVETKQKTIFNDSHLLYLCSLETTL